MVDKRLRPDGRVLVGIPGAGTKRVALYRALEAVICAGCDGVAYYGEPVTRGRGASGRMGPLCRTCSRFVEPVA